MAAAEEEGVPHWVAAPALPHLEAFECCRLVQPCNWRRLIDRGLDRGCWRGGYISYLSARYLPWRAAKDWRAGGLAPGRTGRTGWHLGGLAGRPCSRLHVWMSGPVLAIYLKCRPSLV